MSENKEKKTRTPRDADSILKGLLNLPLELRVEICNKLKASISAEVADLDQKAKAAKEAANGL